MKQHRLIWCICLLLATLACLANPVFAEEGKAAAESLEHRPSAQEVEKELAVLEARLKVLAEELQQLGQKPYEYSLRAMFALRSELSLENKISDLQQELDIKQQRLALLNDLPYPHLTVKAEPAQAKVRLLGIKPVYRAGMVLEPGQYKLEVSAKGCQTKKQWIELVAGTDKEINIWLHGKPCTEASTGMEFIWVPGGCFSMGDTFDDGDPDERPVHKVCVDGFWLGKTEVTQGQWQVVMGNNPSYFKRGANYPVEQVSWADTQAYIKKLNRKSGRKFRLPTEAEWEYAARSGGRKERYAGGNNVEAVAWYDDNSGDHPHPVGQKQANGLGLYDMSGNVWEWCSDWYGRGYYPSSPRHNPQGPDSGSYRVNRGGSWNDRPRNVRTAYRYWIKLGYHSTNLGFRLALPSRSGGK